MIAQAADSDIYASLGQPFMKTFFTSFDYGKNMVYFGVSTTVTTQGVIREFPPIVIIYLGFTIAIFPPIIAAYCMEYRYCPLRRRNQKTKRTKNLHSKLIKQRKTLAMMAIQAHLIDDENEDKQVFCVSRASIN